MCYYVSVCICTVDTLEPSTDKKDEGEEEDKVEEEREDDAGEPEQKIRRKVGRPKACDRNRMINLKGRKRKLERYKHAWHFSMCWG